MWHMSAMRQTVYSGKSEALDTEMGVYEWQGWRDGEKKRNQHKIKRSELNWQRPQGFGKNLRGQRWSF